MAEIKLFPVSGKAVGANHDPKPYRNIYDNSRWPDNWSRWTGLVHPEDLKRLLAERRRRREKKDSEL